MDKKHDYLNEVIDRLIDSGMEEYEAVALVTCLLEQEAKNFLLMTDYFDLMEPEGNIDVLQLFAHKCLIH